MGYCISYNPELKDKYPLVLKKRRRLGPVILLIMLSALLFKDVRLTVKNWMLPGDAAVTEAALVNMIQQLQAEIPLKEALTTFCLEIAEGAQSQNETTYPN